MPQSMMLHVLPAAAVEKGRMAIQPVVVFVTAGHPMAAAYLFLKFCCQMCASMIVHIALTDVQMI